MAKYNGSGWHFQSKRHSNARKYGKAGGRYSVVELPVYQIKGKQYYRDVRLGEYRNVKDPSDKLDINIPNSMLEKPTMPHPSDVKKKFISDFENMRDNAELRALSNTSLQRPLTDKEYKRFMELGRKAGIFLESPNKKHYGESEYNIDEIANLPEQIILGMDAINRDEKTILSRLNYEFRPQINMWSVAKGDTKYVMQVLRLSRKKADELIIKVLNKLEEKTKTKKDFGSYAVVPRGLGWEHYPIATGFKTEEEARAYAKKEMGSMRGVRITQSTKHYGKSELKEAYQHFSNEDLREAYIDANTQEKKRISRELHRREMPSSNQIANHFYDEDWKWFGKKFGKTPKNHMEAEQIVEDAKKERGY